MFGWTARAAVHWIVSLIGVAILVFANFLIFQSVSHRQQLPSRSNALKAHACDRSSSTCLSRIRGMQHRSLLQTISAGLCSPLRVSCFHDRCLSILASEVCLSVLMVDAFLHNRFDTNLLESGGVSLLAGLSCLGVL